ncbi:hypothetical protein AMK59_7894 [Oryctes borbonicus]|uniref:Tetratricopeptide repeat-containing protein n=1 Tax=Oryctes borbonicus TaxID=1629725 RepID=A0A0T6AY55_9SCAR|nr:hypothetical protein AMK59_7894 [Oryctes borbonicus]
MGNYLTVKCLFDANELSEALKVLNAMDLEVFLQNGNETEFKLFDDTPRNQVQSSVLLLKGKVLEAMDNRGLAADCYRQALQCDVTSHVVPLTKIAEYVPQFHRYYSN